MKCDVPEPRVLLVEHKAQLDKYKVRYSLFFGLFLLDFFFFLHGVKTVPSALVWRQSG